MEMLVGVSRPEKPSKRPPGKLQFPPTWLKERSKHLAGGQAAFCIDNTLSLSGTSKNVLSAWPRIDCKLLFTKYFLKTYFIQPPGCRNEATGSHLVQRARKCSEKTKNLHSPSYLCFQILYTFLKKQIVPVLLLPFAGGSPPWSGMWFVTL